jgi:hypothetical protein
VVPVGGWTTDCTVSDSAGNTYDIAAPRFTGSNPPDASGVQMMVASVANAPPEPLTVTVQTCTSGGVRIFEYSGLDLIAPVDAQVSATADVGEPLFDAGVVTTAPGDLLVAFVLAVGSVTAADPTAMEWFISDGDLFEDKVVGAPGPYSATAMLPSGGWLAQVVALKAGLAADAGPLPGPPRGVDLGGGFRFEQATAAAVGSGLLLSMPQPSTIGNSLFVCIQAVPGGCTVTDNAGDVYAAVAGPVDGQGSLVGQTAMLYQATVLDAGPAPLELSVSCPSFVTAYAAEYSGLGTLDVNATAAASASPSVAVGPFTTMSNGELVVACGVSDAALNAVDGGLTLRFPFLGGAVMDQVLGPPGPHQGVAGASSGTWAMAIAAFMGTSGTDAGPSDAGWSDAGTDGGSPDGGIRPRSLTVGCGCHAAPPGLGLVLTLAVRRRRR